MKTSYLNFANCVFSSKYDNFNAIFSSHAAEEDPVVGTDQFFDSLRNFYSEIALVCLKDQLKEFGERVRIRWGLGSG